MSVSTMIAQAEKSLGWGEPNPIHRWYGARNGSYFARGSTPWCDMSITYWSHHSGNYNAVCFGKDYAYTVWHAQEFQRRGRWVYGTGGIKPGDIIFFQWEGGSRSIGKIDHVGLVYKVTSSYIYTIEGNTSNKCLRKVRAKNSIVTGYGRPAYTSGGKVTPVPSGSSGGSSGYNYMTSVRSVTNQQKAVNQLGYSPKLVVDGAFGPKTNAGVRWAQKKLGVAVDGQWGPKTEAAFKKATGSKTPAKKVTVPKGMPYLRRGSRGTRVTQLQKALTKAGHRLSADGIFGPKTQAAVRAFQKKSRLSQDGVYGPRTEAALRRKVG